MPSWAACRWGGGTATDHLPPRPPQCYVGVGSTVSGQAFPCTEAPLYLNLYMFFNVRAAGLRVEVVHTVNCPPRVALPQILFNILIIAMLKYGSSNILWLCLTIQVPVQNLIWAIPGMPSGAPVTWEAGVGLIIIMGGLVVYRFWPVLRPRLRAALGMPPAEEDIAAAAKLAAAEAAAASAPPGEGDQFGALEQSPASTVAGSTPVRGLGTHMAPGKKGGAAARAQGLAQARKALDNDDPAVN